MLSSQKTLNSIKGFQSFFFRNGRVRGCSIHMWQISQNWGKILWCRFSLQWHGNEPDKSHINEWICVYTQGQIT